MASDNSWADPDELAGISRSGNVLAQMGYDPEEARGNPAMRSEIMGKLASPYAMTPGAQGSPAPRPAPNPAQAVAAPAAAQAAPSTPAPAPTPMPAPKPQVTASSSSQVSPTGTPASTAAPSAPTPASASGMGLDEIGVEALNRGMKLGGLAEQTAKDMAASTGPDTAALEAQRSKDALPTPYRDPHTGKVLESAEEAGYKPGIWTEIGRGVRGALVGGLTGGIPGALVGAIEPQDIHGGTAYGAPDRAYQATEQARQARVGSEDQQIANMKDKFKEQTDARGKAAAELRQGVMAFNDTAKQSADLENANTNIAKNDTQLRKAGFKTNEKGEVVPLDRSEMSQSQQAIADLQNAKQEEEEARAEFERSKNDPNSPAFQLARARLATAQRNSQTAVDRLSLSREEFDMHSRGTDAHGVPLPGSALLPGGVSVGTAFQHNVLPTGTQRDAAGRAVTMDALSTRLESGLNDPDIQKYMGPAGGRLAEAEGRLGTLPPKVAEFRNDMVSYGAFQAGLHPVRGIGALEYFDKVMGGLGQTPDELRGKLSSNKATSASVQGVGTPKIAGGSPTPAAGGYASQFPEAH